ncbi:MAG: TetR family transcriptional regulator C-terminal domain-containing protein [Acidimicrobiales bacterium]|nr:TetR family transcriptional regulator C-terminal domain-containing protein [Acidimicrobiales bacterium]
MIDPARAAPEGLAQLEALCECYLSYVEREVFPGGRFFAQLFAEFDATSDRMHDMVVAGHANWHGLFAEMVTAAQRLGEVDPDVEPDQLAFELYAHLEGANYLATLHRDPGLVGRGRRAVHATLALGVSAVAVLTRWPPRSGE